MKKETSITKADSLLQQLDEINFRVVTVEQAGNAMTFAKKLKDFASIVEKKVKKRATEIMDEEEITEIDMGEFSAKRVEPSAGAEYNAKSVIDGLGEKAYPFLKVTGGKLESYLKKASAKGVVSMEEIKKCKDKIVIKLKAGYIRIATNRKN